MNQHVAPQTLGDILEVAMRSAKAERAPIPSAPSQRARIAAARFDGLTKVGREMPCMRCGADAVTVGMHSRGGMDIEQVECGCCGLRYRRVNP